MLIKLSILIPVFTGREILLNHALKSLERQKINIPFETIILNDGLESNMLNGIINKYKKSLNINYIFLGQRNVNNQSKIFWRDAGFAINYGIKHCNEDLLLIHEPEIYCLDDQQVNKMIEPHLKQEKLLTHPQRVYIDTGELLSIINNNKEPNKEQLSKIKNFYHSHFHYSIMLKKKELIEIGGWDEDFLGTCYTDGDINDRLEANGIKFMPLDFECIHLFHQRINCINWQYNKKLYEERKGIIKRNQNKNWGMNIWSPL